MSKRERRWWLVGSLVCLYIGATTVYEAYWHEGGGEVTMRSDLDYDRGTAGPRWVIERDYKIHKYVHGGMFVLIGGAICALINEKFFRHLLFKSRSG